MVYESVLQVVITTKAKKTGKVAKADRKGCSLVVEDGMEKLEGGPPFKDNSTLQKAVLTYFGRNYIVVIR
jgi:hypothetical protein